MGRRLNTGANMYQIYDLCNKRVNFQFETKIKNILFLLLSSTVAISLTQEEVINKRKAISQYIIMCVH